MSVYHTIKSRVFNVLEVSKHKGDLSWKIDAFIIVLIILNVVAIILESVETISMEYSSEFFYFELFSVIVFTIEYIFRIWVSNLYPSYGHPVTGRLKYALTPLALIDLLAILPFYLLFTSLDLRLLRMFRIFRIFRLFKIARYISALSLINRVVSRKKEELIISLIFTLFLLLLTSTIMYYVENGAQPEKFSSIPETMWWGISTLTTVGYGDMYPITAMGQFLGGMIAIIGIGLFALPTGILASGFSQELAHQSHQAESCPSCGRPF